MSVARQLRCYMNLMALESFWDGSSRPRRSFAEQLSELKAAGFEGVQFTEQATKERLESCRQIGFGMASSGRVNTAEDASTLAKRAACEGFECATLHVGWGLENDNLAHSLIESILQASQRWSLPLYIETHRATICQDMWRTVGFVERFPEMRFNGDFSHWYAGQEMVYGGFGRKLDFIRPVLDRVRFLHGRIANPGCIQVPVNPASTPEPEYVNHFRELWTECFRGFLQTDDMLKHICFTPELLAPDIYYARTFDGHEESDRWEQSMILKQIAEECFQCAQSC